MSLTGNVELIREFRLRIWPDEVMRDLLRVLRAQRLNVLQTMLKNILTSLTLSSVKLSPLCSTIKGSISLSVSYKIFERCLWNKYFTRTALQTLWRKLMFLVLLFECNEHSTEITRPQTVKETNTNSQNPQNYFNVSLVWCKRPYKFVLTINRRLTKTTAHFLSSLCRSLPVF
jgi:hypothetical protein